MLGKYIYKDENGSFKSKPKSLKRITFFINMKLVIEYKLQEKISFY